MRNGGGSAARDSKLPACLAGVIFGLVALAPVAPAASPNITNPARFVSEVYQQFVRAESSNAPYTPPEDMYTPRLKGLFAKYQDATKGEVGCLDFVFWVNAQDWELTDIKSTVRGTGPNQQTVIARFTNIGAPQEIHFDFRRIAGRWLLDDARSIRDPRWTLSQILNCPM